MEFEEPEQQRGPPLPKIKARDSQGRAAYRRLQAMEKPRGQEACLRSALMLRERGESRGAVEGAVLREGSRVLRHR